MAVRAEVLQVSELQCPQIEHFQGCLERAYPVLMPGQLCILLYITV